MDNRILTDALDSIPASEVSYDEWLGIGMALKQEGLPVDVWDRWSSTDTVRYRAGNCAKKWDSFHGCTTPVTGGTILAMAKNRGWTMPEGEALDWNAAINDSGKSFIPRPAPPKHEPVCILDPAALAPAPMPELREWNPAKELARYLRTVYAKGAHVCYCLDSMQTDGKYRPASAGRCDRTAEELATALDSCGGDIESVIGPYNHEAGGWIVANPTDGHGRKRENITDFRFALIESDSQPLDVQYTTLKALNLPIAVMLYSGGKSIHAIVRIDAADETEYRSRVECCLAICRDNGLDPDPATKDPSRLSRMPGLERGTARQYILHTNIGAKDWDSWMRWIEDADQEEEPEPEPSALDSFPRIVTLREALTDLPPLREALIEGILRLGHKMLFSGPSKAGKSFAMMELALAVASGTKWMKKFQCLKGRVLYANMELDEISCHHRFDDIRKNIELSATEDSESQDNLDIWNLRGVYSPLDRLMDGILEASRIRGPYALIVVDPMYKTLTGDENSASDMARYVSYFDRICKETGASVVYSHHHSKGNQGHKNSIDRGSGSGVMARDGDTIADILDIKKGKTGMARDTLQNMRVAEAAKQFLAQNGVACDDVDPKTFEYADESIRLCQERLPEGVLKGFMSATEDIKRRVDSMLALRLTFTLREFPAMEPIDLWFDAPVHCPDETGQLAGIPIGHEDDLDTEPRIDRETQQELNRQARMDGLTRAFNVVQKDGDADPKALMKQMKVSVDTLKRTVAKHPDFVWVKGGEAGVRRAVVRLTSKASTENAEETVE